MSIPLVATPVRTVTRATDPDQGGEILLPKSSDLPPGFLVDEEDGRTHLTQSLSKLDRRFSGEDVHLRSFTERPDTDARYRITTVAIALPNPGAVSLVRTLAWDYYADLMQRYDSVEVPTWETDPTPAHPYQRLYLWNDLRVTPATAREWDWMPDARAVPYSDQWAVTANDHQAVLTMVDGPQHGPWRPQDLLEQTNGIIHRRLSA